MNDDDFKLISGIFYRLADKEKKFGVNSLTEEERVVLSVWHASGIIGNGGFQYFYEQELDAESTALAYGKIGCKKCAEILRSSLLMFPTSILQADWNKRIQFIEKNGKKFYNLSNAFWEADEGMQAQLAKYIRHHAEAFTR